MTKTAKRVVKAKVGRPAGSAKKVSDAQRIRNVLTKFGVDAPASDVKAYLTNPRSAGVGPKTALAFRAQGKTLDVKISQVRSTLQAKAGLPTRKGKGRMTNTEKELIKVKLQLERTQAELASLKAPVVEAPVVEAPVVEAPVVEAPVAETPVVETPVVETPVVETPVVETPVVETPVVEALTIDAVPAPVAA